MAVLLFACLTAGACAKRAGTPVATPPPVAPEPVAAAEPQPAPDNGPLRLHEVRLIETAGQRSMLFRFSRPPEGVDYFPLRSPSRLVIDVKGPIDPLTKIHSYKAADALVTAVRVGTYQGRLRLVIDLKAAAIPQFSVDNYETLVTAFLGEKTSPDLAAQSNAQVLFISDEGRDSYLADAARQPEKPAVAVAPEAAPPEEAVAAAAPPSGPAEKITTSAEPEAPRAGQSAAEGVAPSPPAPDEPALTEESLPPSRIEEKGRAAEVGEEKTVEIAQAQATPPPAPPATQRTTPPPPVVEDLSPTSGEFRPASATQYTGRKISLDFKNADIHDVFRILADVSGLNIVATDDVRARVTLRLVEIPWDQALDVVLQANGLERTQVGNVITISTTRRLEAERTARLAAQNAQQKIAPLETAYIQVNYVKATDVVSMIAREALQTAGAGGGAAAAAAGAGGRTQVALMSPRGTLTADPTTNVVIVRDTADRIATIRELIRVIDQQTPQVVIESYLVTTNENITRDLGIQWGYSYQAGPRTGNPTGVNFPGNIGIGGIPGLLNPGTGVPFIADFPASASPGSGSALDFALGSLSGSQALNIRLTALESNGKARIISRPRVVTLNNKVANIRSRRVVRVPIISGALTVGGAGTSGGGGAFEEFDVGITLKITPQISSDGYVLLDVDAESSELTDASATTEGASQSVPSIPDSLVRTASSSVLIRAGDTFVLGGILQDNMRQSERGIPYLRDTPGIGWLFQGRLKSRVKDELLVFITPKLVAGVSTAGLPSARQLWEGRDRGEAPPQAGAAAVAR